MPPTTNYIQTVRILGLIPSSQKVNFFLFVVHYLTACWRSPLGLVLKSNVHALGN